MDINEFELLAYQRIADTGLSFRELAEMDMTEYARVTGRPTPVEAAIAALDTQHAANQTPQTPRPSPAVPDAGQPVDISSLSVDEYAALRDQFGVHGQREGRGIFDSVGSQSQVYRDAVRAQSGRTALNNTRVVEPPRLEGRFVRQDDIRDARAAAQRFSTPGNAFS